MERESRFQFSARGIGRSVVHAPFAARLQNGSAGQPGGWTIRCAQYPGATGVVRDATALQRDKLLLTTLAAAYAEMKTLQGPDPGQWTWGKLHHNFSEHPFSRVVDEAEQKQLDVGPLETGGSAFTVNASSYRAQDFQQLSGPSVRMVLDVGNWDNSRAVNYPGESGIKTVRTTAIWRLCGPQEHIFSCCIQGRR